ncbi:MAG: hypothetical protein CMJ83_08905 [Planctomycetes bacterium]|jgi:L-lactate dehydrogenase complex protein LldE|nr:hypothetical protein [Planctomycetota bacterium]
MRVALFPTCLVDQFWPSVGVATVRVLRRVGCEVMFDEQLTCCGQPAFNTGYREEAARVAGPVVDRLDAMGVDAVVVPSGSCGAMFRHLTEVFPSGPRADRARAVASMTHELSSFLVDVLGRTDVGGRFDGRVTWHDGCHGLRELSIHSAPRRLIADVEGAELVEMGSADSCCGFGGTFSVKYPEISVAMLDAKLEKLPNADVRAVVSGDVSCLMQIGGRLSRLGSPVKALHLAELLAGSEGAS